MIPLAKSVVNETNEGFGGLYNGQLTPNLSIRGHVEASDVILHIRSFPCDSNTGG